MARRGVLQRLIPENGLFYYVEREEGNKKYLHCRLINDGCTARGYKIGSNPIVLTQPHLHAADLSEFKRRDYRNYLIELSHKYFLPTEEIYQSTSLEFPEEAVLLPYSNVQNLMNNHQKRIILPNPENFQSVCDLLTNEYGTFRKYHHDDEHVDHYLSFRNIENEGLLIYASNITASSELKNLHFSSTTRIIPGFGNTQLITYITTKVQKYIFPVAMVLWSQRSIETTNEVMGFIHHIANNVTEISTDFDLKNCITSIWSQANCETIGTFDSFCRILYQEASDRLNLQNAEHIIFLKKCMVTILLKADTVNNAFEHLTNSLEERLRLELQEFITYFRSTWIESIKFNNISLFEKPSGLNKAADIFWKNLVDRFGYQPNFTCFMREIVILMNDATKDLRRLKTKPSTQLSKFHSVAKLIIDKTRIQNLWKLVKKNKIAENALLDRFSTIIESYYNNHVHNVEILVPSQLININGPNVMYAASRVNNLHQEESNPMVMNNTLMCLICEQKLINITCIPCGHVRMCNECAEEITDNMRSGILRCPFCNNQADFIRAYLP